MSGLVTLQGEPIRKGRLSPALQSAVALMVQEGLSVSMAAQRTGYKQESLTRALMKPHVRVYVADIKRAWREGEAPKAWNRIVDLARSAKSEKVRLEANKTIMTALGDLDVERGGPVSTTLIQFIRNEFPGHSLTQRLPGVQQVEGYQDGEFEPLDPDASLTPMERP